VKQVRIDGSVDTPTTEPVLQRNADGTLPAKHLKAIKWYLLSKGYLPTATNTWPTYHFKKKDGTYVEVHLKDMLAEYEEFRRTTHGKRQQAA
jgi:hypothetical protein